MNLDSLIIICALAGYAGGTVAAVLIARLFCCARDVGRRH